MIGVIKNKFSTILAEKLLKINKISNDTGISRTTLTNLYYRRNKCVSFDVLAKLCKYLKCNVQDIFEYVEKTDFGEEHNESDI